ncbi:fasciclin domain-containing protein [Paracoccus sp. MBLB3053]|uniref:Fasciclin domain-containing protein n=1 Tax=Paracoccus aurantius TaxID=3073814 RepID=A0ABU2HYM3_9RHOB|nr:fasciclin domain-containing protein [Paracoccus sp. MBLB3053]MDS9470152.1 fasciclin domain-containing protein [Paracoccus sp. MBLB3053]
MTFAKFGAAAAVALSLSTVAATADMHGSMPATVVEIVTGSEDHETLEQAVIAAGLADTLSGAGPFTVFGPTDAAFAALPEGALDDALKPENVETLQKILGCHVVASKAMAADVIGLVEQGGGMAEVTTIGNCRLRLSVMDGKVMINDAVTVTAADLAAGNGVVHVIDGVLLPAS